MNVSNSVVVLTGVVSIIALTSCGSARLPPGEALPTRGEESTTIASDDPVGSDGPAPLGDPEVTIDGTDGEPLIETTTSESWVDVTSNLVGLPSTCGNVSIVSAHPDRDEVIAGIAAHGMWTLEGVTGEWSPLGDGAGSAVITNRTTSIEYDRDNPDRFWESGAYGEGVFRTDDGGVTFRRLGDLRHVDSISVDMADPTRRILLSGAHEQRAVFRSTDGGESWTDISGELPADVGNTAYALVLDEETYLIGSYGTGGAGIFRTTDAGASWSRVHAGAVRGLPLLHEEKIYWLLNGGGGVVVSTDGGVTFEQSGGKFANRATNLDLLPDGRLITVADRSLVVSDDDGRRWRSLGPSLPFKPVGVAFAEKSSAVYIWQNTCLFGETTPVEPQSITKLELTFADL